MTDLLCMPSAFEAITPSSASMPALVDSSIIPYYARSFGDPHSRLFWHEGKLHLGVLSAHRSTFEEVLHSAVYRQLVDKNLLIDVVPATLYAELFDLSFRLDHTPRIVYWHEWSPWMLRAAALRMIELLSTLAENGFTLRNPHPWNLLFDGNHFSYLNVGSVVPLGAETFARSYEKVAQYFVRPLLLMEAGLGHTARCLTRDYREGVLDSDIAHVEELWSERSPDDSGERTVAFLEKVGARVAALKSHTQPKRWIDYFQTDCDFGPGTSWTRKQEALLALLQDPGIHSVVDLGANTGHYAALAAENGREVTAIDFDAALVDRIFGRTQDSGVPLYPAVLDFAFPTCPAGVDCRWFPPAAERFQSDLVLCFALAHHMVFGRYRLDFEQIARGIRSFSRTWALVEYVERGKIRPAEWRPDADRWYTVDRFAETLRRHFPVVTVMPSARDGRRLLLCGPEGRRL